MKDVKLDDRDQQIIKLLLENPKGLQPSQILRLLKWNKKTLQGHLNSLLNHKVIFKEKDETKAKNSKTTYKAFATKENEELFNNINDYYLRSKELLQIKNNNKMAILSAFPHLMQVFSVNYYSLINFYLMRQKGDYLYEVMMKMMNEKLKEFRDYMRNNFSKKQIQRIHAESNIILEVDQIIANEKVLYVMMGRPYYRTQDEILLDNDHLDSDPLEKRLFDTKITKRRSELIEDPKIKSYLENLAKKHETAIRRIEKNHIAQIISGTPNDKSMKRRKITEIIDKQMDLLSPFMQKYTTSLEKKLGIRN